MFEMIDKTFGDSKKGDLKALLEEADFYIHVFMLPDQDEQDVIDQLNHDSKYLFDRRINVQKRIAKAVRLLAEMNIEVRNLD